MNCLVGVSVANGVTTEPVHPTSANKGMDLLRRKNMSHYETLGGELKVRAIIDTFVDRMTSDIMLGFFFKNVPIARLKELEFQHAAEFLGADIRYTGRPLREAHRKHNIMGGQFARRKQILQEVLQDFAVPQEICDAWLNHVESLRSEITQQKSSQCD